MRVGSEYGRYLAAAHVIRGLMFANDITLVDNPEQPSAKSASIEVAVVVGSAAADCSRD